MDKKNSMIESFSIDRPLIEWVDVQVPCETADKPSSDLKPPAKNGKVSSPGPKKKKPNRRRKN
jgi:hypothetical protein